MKGKTEKAALIDDIHGRFAKAQVAVVAEYRGLGVEELRTLRTKLRSAGGEFKVVKNTLARKAAEDTGLADMRKYFDGPIGVALGYEDPAALAKAIKEFAGQQEKLKLRSAVLEGRLLDLAGLARVAALPSRQVLLGRLVGQMQAPVTGLVFSLQGIVRKYVATMGAVLAKRTAEGA
ncbi:MAG: 50S ribosomal protein L10 [Nitrospirae bacterium]|nr:50S ribosomal protein L10 [Nitrospirota bacterium]